VDEALDSINTINLVDGFFIDSQPLICELRAPYQYLTVPSQQVEYHVIKDGTQPGLGPPKEIHKVLPPVGEGEAGADYAEGYHWISLIPVTEDDPFWVKKGNQPPYLLWRIPQPDAGMARRHELQREGVLDVLIRRAPDPSPLALQKQVQRPPPRPFLAALPPLRKAKKNSPRPPQTLRMCLATCARASD
jgi:hypothetical protein